MLAYLIIAVALSLVYFFSETFFHHLKRIEVKLVSFSAGLFITSIFLVMLPVLIKSSFSKGMNSFFIALWGFVILHIFEKYTSQYSKKEAEYQKNLLKLRVLSLIINNLMLGYALLFFFVAKTSTLGYLLLLPLIIHLFSSAVISEEAHKILQSTITGKIIASCTVFVGALLAIILSPFPHIMIYIFSFALGVFIYVIVRDVIPSERRGDVFYFIYGIITFFLILGVSEIIFAFL
ncbi:MAG: hypothetical protein QXG86_00635 [Candidatus Woesearchaeota archaeon]